MQIDKYIGMSADILALGGYSFRELAAKWERPFDMRSYDRIEVTEKELNEMLALSWKKEEFGSELIENPALHEFTVFVKVPGTNMGTVVCYRKSLLTHEVVDKQKDTVITYKPFIDAYVHFLGSPQSLDMVVTISKVIMKKVDGTQEVTMSSSQDMWIGVKSPILVEAAQADYPLIAEYCRDIKLIYMSLQYFLRHRPVLFKEFSERHTVQRKQGHGKTAKYINKVRAIKVITIVPEELEIVRSAATHSITCPCWGVMGHWRTYKTGKQIWIQPYKKGKERHNPAAYQPKEYDICKEAYQ